MELDFEQILQDFGTLEKKNPENLNSTKNKSNINTDICLECKSHDIIISNGEIICRSCGCINDTVIDANAEWRYYGSDDSKFSDPTRCGLPTNDLLPQSSLGSSIGYRYGESFEMRKIRNYHP